MIWRVPCKIYQHFFEGGSLKKVGRHQKKIRWAPWKNLGRFYRVPFKSILRVQIKRVSISKVIKNRKKWAQNYRLNVNATFLLIGLIVFCSYFSQGRSIQKSVLQQNFSSGQFQELQWIDIWFLNAAGLINKLRNIFPPENIRALTRSNLILISYWKVIITSWHKSVLQGHRTQIDTFQNNNFLLRLNDILFYISEKSREFSAWFFATILNNNKQSKRSWRPREVD